MSVHTQAKQLELVLKSAFRESLMSLHERVGVVKSLASEAMAFLEAGNVPQSAQSISDLYYAMQELQERINEVANNG